MNTNEHVEFLQHNNLENAKENARSIKVRLEESINKCSALKGAVAFWSIEMNYLNGLGKALKQDDSFICVDIHQPTNINYLRDFAEYGVRNIYLFLYRVNAGKYPLLHTKLFLMDFSDNTSEVWIGSQNFTHSAIAGSNLESTTVISTTKGSKLYIQISNYLEFIKKCCSDIEILYSEVRKCFDINQLEFYKKLQNTYDSKEKIHKTLDIVCDNIDDIRLLSRQKGKYILVAVFNEREVINAFSVKKEILVRALDKQKRVICYAAKVHSVSDIIPENKGITYTSSDGENYQISSFIVQQSKGLIPIFSQEAVTGISKYSVFVIISMMYEFKQNLYPSKKEIFWKASSTENSSDLTYLNSLSEARKKKIQLPKSPSDMKSISFYPFDKIYHSDNLTQEIAVLHQMLVAIQTGTFSLNNPIEPPENSKLMGKKRIIRILASDAEIDTESLSSQQTDLAYPPSPAGRGL